MNVEVESWSGITVADTVHDFLLGKAKRARPLKPQASLICCDSSRNSGAYPVGIK